MTIDEYESINFSSICKFYSLSLLSMSNRLLSFLVITAVFGGLFGAYYYFFTLSTGNVSVLLNGSGSANVTLVSEFGNSYSRECDRSCLFDSIPAVNYTVSAKRDDYTPITKTFLLERGETKKIMLAMEKEIVLAEQTKKKEDTIAAIKLRKDIQDTLEENSGSIVLGYRPEGLYYAIKKEAGWTMSMKKEGADARELFRIPEGTLREDSLDIYEGYIALEKQKKISFYSLSNGEGMDFGFDGNILGIKDSPDANAKIITASDGAYIYTVSEKTARKNPLYDDIIALPSGDIVALVKKTSKEKRSLLSIPDASNDYVFLIGDDTRTRKTLLQTPKDGRLLRYRNGEILFVDAENTAFVVKNVK